MSNVRLEFDVGKAVAARAPLFAKAQAQLDAQILKDCEPFVPKAGNFLRSSGVISSGGGEIVYSMPYARYQYYLNEGAHYTTPGTMAKWFEHGKALYRKEWLELVQRSFE